MTNTIAGIDKVDFDGNSERFRLHRAGILNVWQYDQQEFSFADGRLLLRGANGAGKSKTLEMLLPFALDGDKARITASAKHHTSLLWLMTDGYEGQTRVGYIWVEFLRICPDGTEEAFTCGVGIRASGTARAATSWHFATSRTIGRDLSLEDEAGPLSRPKLEEVLGAEGHVFEKASDYKEHVGRVLFGLDPKQYDEVLRLLYWLRQPQVGEEIEPAKLAKQLSQALPQLDEQAVRSAGDTFDELTAFGEQIERRTNAAQALGLLSNAYTAYAQAAVASRARAVGDALYSERRLLAAVKNTLSAVEVIVSQQAGAEKARDKARGGAQADKARLRELEASPEFRDQRRLAELGELAVRDAATARETKARRIREAENAARLTRVERERAELTETSVSAQRDRLRALDRRQRKAVLGTSIAVPVLLEGLTLDRVEQRPMVEGALEHSIGALREASSSVNQRRAGVDVVRRAIADFDNASAVQRDADREADRSEARWERARNARLTAASAVALEAGELTTLLADWAGAANAPELELPNELSEDFVSSLPVLARQAAAPLLQSLHRDDERTLARQEAANVEIQRLDAERAVIEDQSDLAPAPPVLPRTERTQGRALWEVVDFAEGLEEGSRAGLEAALQAAGLLDALLLPGGLLLGPHQQDVILAAPDPSQLREGTLLDLLVPVLPAECDLSAADVRRVLTGIGAGPDPTTPTWMTTDGTWRLGPAHGRANKEQAQFIGSTARAHERSRRLGVIDAARAKYQAAVLEAAETHKALVAQIVELETWVAAVPSGKSLLQLWARLEWYREIEEREESDNRTKQTAAHAARATAAEARSTVERRAAEHDLPPDLGLLEATEQELKSLSEDLLEAIRQDAPIRTSLKLWEDAVVDMKSANAALRAEEEAEVGAEQRVDASEAALKELLASVGNSVQELEGRISTLKTSLAAHERDERNAAERMDTLREKYGEVQADARNAKNLLEEHLKRRAALFTSLLAALEVPGMVKASGADQDGVAEAAGLASHEPTEPVSRAVASAVDALAALSHEDATAAANRVWRSDSGATNGPAADHQLIVAEFGDLLTVTGRDDAGEAVVLDLAQRVNASINRDRDLLTEREKRQFEQHILGELGDAIRRCRRDAEELVIAMNEQLAQVSTSQGIRVKLSWRLRDDVPPEARAAVELLTQPVGALIPEERANLRDVLHRLIEASRAERPELSYGEHLAAALDYRTWSEFTIRYTRPEKPGHWERLHRRSALSQGEQKVLCYLPLFAAAAAHFTSLAGAAPNAPRLVLLDDAFPKIDARTHPLLFGLLVQLDLDFVITSERLWGDHDTVPSLAIYEALRDPGQRGIAQYEHRWDGRILHALG